MSERHYFCTKIGKKHYRVLDTLDLVTEKVRLEDFIEIFSDKFINADFCENGRILSENYRKNYFSQDLVDYYMRTYITHSYHTLMFSIKDGKVAYLYNGNIFGDILVIDFRGKRHQICVTPFVESSMGRQSFSLIRFGNTLLDVYRPPEDTSINNSDFFCVTDMEYKKGVLKIVFQNKRLSLVIKLNYDTGEVSYETDKQYSKDPLYSLNESLKSLELSLINKQGERLANEQHVGNIAIGCRMKFLVSATVVEGVDFKCLANILKLYFSSDRLEVNNYRKMMMMNYQNLLNNYKVNEETKKFCTKCLFLYQR